MTTPPDSGFGGSRLPTIIKRWETLSEDEIFHIQVERRSGIYCIDRGTLLFHGIENRVKKVELVEPFQFPPAESFYEKVATSLKDPAQIQAAIRWKSFHLLTYFHGGEIWFRKIAPDIFEVNVQFPNLANNI